MNTGVNERGFLSLKVLLILVIAGCFFTFGFITVPTYLDNRFVESALKTAGEMEPSLHKLSKSEIKGRIQKVFTLNNVRGEPSEAIEVVRLKEKTFVNVNYAVRKNLFRNLDVIMTFENQLDSSRPDLFGSLILYISGKSDVG
ncbi:MAG: DUF4845 domain-containing protein [Exilibacterium sp.]